jgi:hypothetical protein
MDSSTTKERESVAKTLKDAREIAARGENQNGNHTYRD